MNLNAEQQQAVDHGEGICVVTAVPGSGKTATLTARVINLIQERHVDPSNILCLTFTNKAANEMRERVSQKSGQQSDQVWISTFHRLCIGVLRKYGKHVGLESGFSIYTDKDQKDLMDKVMRMYAVEPDSRDKAINHLCGVVNDFREDIEDFESHVADLKSPGPEMINEYLHLLDKWNAVDFSGILYKTWLLFKKEPKAADILHHKFQHILVDEMQDTNTIQYEIVRAIADPKKTRKSNLFVVGDFNQSIFSWRGARPENIQKVEKDFDDVKQIILPRNYRSTSKILTAAQNLIRKNGNAKDVTLISERGDGHPVVVKTYQDPESEANSIAATIQAIKAKNGYRFSDFAVLYRTNSLSKQIEITMRKYNLPYKIVGGFSFFDRKEIKDALAYLSFMTNPNDTIQFARAISVPKRHLGTTAIGRIEKYAYDHNVSIWEACKSPDVKLSAKMQEGLEGFKSVIEEAKKKTSLTETVACLMKDSGYHEYLVEEDSKNKKTAANSRADNLNEFLVGVADYESKKPNATVSDFLHTVQIMTSDMMDKDDTDDAVTLLTMHSAKGLEFPVVFIVGAEQDIIPHQRSVNEGGLGEERRLMYVAVTRAKDYLAITQCMTRRQYAFGMKRNYIKMCKPSMFLEEMEV